MASLPDPPLPGHSPVNSVSESTTALVQTIFRAVWNEFYDWEQKYSQEAINSLAGPIPTKMARNSIVEIVNKNLELTNENNAFSEDSTIIEAPKLKFSPYPTYEACTPLSGNIWKGDDSPHMPFVPYADEPNFKHVEYSLAYDDFDWQNGNRDPDRQYITTSIESHIR